MLLVDGLNLAHQDPLACRLIDERKMDAVRSRVIEIVETYARTRNEHALIVFDGTGGPPAPERGRIRHIIAGPGRTADEEIKRQLRTSTAARDTTVVTDDRDLRAAARTLGARTLGSGELVKSLARLSLAPRPDLPPEPAGKHIGAPPTEVDYWLREFRDEDIARIEQETPPVPRPRKKPS